MMETALQHLSELISVLALEVKGLRLELEMNRRQGRFKPANKQDLEHWSKQIMASVSESIKAYSDAVNTAYDKIGTAVDGIQKDVDFLKQKIDQIQNSPGTLSTADQAALDALQARASALSDKIAALDDQTEEPPELPATTA